MKTDMQERRGNYFAFGLLLPILLTVLIQAGDACANPDVVTRLVESEGEIYALDLTDNPLVRENLTARYDPFLNSWERVVGVPGAVFEAADKPVSLPLTQCVAGDPSICYRIEGQERVLESIDGGESWNTAWKVPAGRRLFMARAADFCKGAIDMGPYDMLISGPGDEHQVFVAMGNEGVVLRQRDGSWERQQAGNAVPTAYRATTLLEFLVTVPAELGGWLVFVFIYGVGQYLFFMRRLRMILTPLTWAALIFVTGSLLLVYALVTGQGLLDWGLILLVAVLYTVPVYLAYRKWEGESYNHMDDPEKGQKAGRIWMGSTVGLFFGGLLLVFLWPLGIIPFYWLMGLVVLGTAVGVAMWGSRRIYQLLEEAVF